VTTLTVTFKAMDADNSGSLNQGSSRLLLQALDDEENELDTN
jgi:hypothetical protein